MNTNSPVALAGEIFAAKARSRKVAAAMPIEENFAGLWRCSSAPMKSEKARAVP